MPNKKIIVVIDLQKISKINREICLIIDWNIFIMEYTRNTYYIIIINNIYIRSCV